MVDSWLSSLEQPFPWLFVITAVALVWVWRKQPEARRRLWWVIVPFTILWIFCMPLTAHFVMGSLEWSNPPAGPRSADTKAIVVLAGGLIGADAVRPKAILSEDTLFRCLHGAEVYHEGPPCKVLLSGGKMEINKAGPALAEAMQEVILLMGVRPQDILVESTSQSTYENAVESAKILKPLGIDRVVLVTDASHLPRAMACFRAQGIEPIPSGCRYRATSFSWTISTFVPQPNGARNTHQALREWLGRIYYRMRGKA